MALVISPADTAHAAARVYTWSLLATVPLLIGWVAALLLARAPASARLLVWRAAIVSLALMFVAQLLPLRWGAGVLPFQVARPLVSLGRIEVGSADPLSREALVLSLLLCAYVAGVLATLTSTAAGLLEVRRIARHSEPVGDGVWIRMLDDVRAELGIGRRVALLYGRSPAVPITWGIVHPVVFIPAHALDWSAAERRALLLHELTHVRRGDVVVRLASRVILALFWFHPLAWIASRELERASELACDDRVLTAGVKQSDYAALLLRASEAARGRSWAPAASMGAVRSSMRERLGAILDPMRDRRAAGRAQVAAAAIATLVVSVPLGAFRPAPTREVLTSLMRDARWDTRAYAVIGLAQRPDSLAIARSAARNDPSPRVRALASSALAQQGIVLDTRD